MLQGIPLHDPSAAVAWASWRLLPNPSLAQEARPAWRQQISLSFPQLAHVSLCVRGCALDAGTASRQVDPCVRHSPLTHACAQAMEAEGHLKLLRNPHGVLLVKAVARRSSPGPSRRPAADGSALRAPAIADARGGSMGTQRQQRGRPEDAPPAPPQRPKTLEFTPLRVLLLPPSHYSTQQHVRLVITPQVAPAAQSCARASPPSHGSRNGPLHQRALLQDEGKDAAREGAEGPPSELQPVIGRHLPLVSATAAAPQPLRAQAPAPPQARLPASLLPVLFPREKQQQQQQQQQVQHQSAAGAPAAPSEHLPRARAAVHRIREMEASTPGAQPDLLARLGSVFEARGTPNRGTPATDASSPVLAAVAATLLSVRAAKPAAPPAASASRRARGSVDVDWPLCPFELRGSCRNAACR